jgi:glycosyltransferase involved in cell wall biosynthesis
MSEQDYRVAVVTGGLPFGGTTAFLLNLVPALRNAGVLARVFSLTHANPFADEFEKAGISVHLCDDRKQIFEDRVVHTYTALAEFSPAVVLANIGQEAYEMLRYLPVGVARVGIIHDRAQEPRRVLTTYRGVLDHVIVVAAHLLADVQAVAPATPCAHLPHGISMPAHVAPRNPNRAAPLRLIYFGRLTEGKGARLFPKIVDELHRRQIPFTWTIHGTGPEEAFLREHLAGEILSGEVLISPPVPRDSLFQMLQRHDVYVLASDTEGGPLTLLEAMAMGLVPVCGDIPCLVQEVINPKTGFRVERSNAGTYAEAIAKLHAARDLLERMSLAAQQAITAEYSLRAMGERYTRFLRGLVGDQPSGSWPATIHPRPILNAEHPLAFSPISRPIRRLAKRLKSS